MRGAQLEIVEVDTFPAHGDLDHAMKLAERKTRRHHNAPPHHRADPDQPEFDLEDRVGVHREVRNERLRPSFHAARLLPPSLSVARHPRDPDALSTGRFVLRAGDEREAEEVIERFNLTPASAAVVRHGLHGPGPKGAPFLAIMQIDNSKYEQLLVN